ncbi:hypothetical protein, partial [uncultured Adlercreutzia sp.]|uniref:hypothetical protein n=1 Tax=uncultured Adlercreutzia sp. TaxID=875803 RepID=UPI00266D71C5
FRWFHFNFFDGFILTFRKPGAAGSTARGGKAAVAKTGPGEGISGVRTVPNPVVLPKLWRVISAVGPSCKANRTKLSLWQLSKMVGR